jgi:hypothetical protein
MDSLVSFSSFSAIAMMSWMTTILSYGETGKAVMRRIVKRGGTLHKVIIGYGGVILLAIGLVVQKN